MKADLSLKSLRLAAPPSSFCRTICSLQGIPAPAAVSDEDDLDSATAGAEPDGKGNSQDNSTRYMEILLHPSTYHSVLDLAPSPEVRSAWDEGRALPLDQVPLSSSPISPNIIHVTKSEAARTIPMFPEYAIKKQYIDALAWWEDYAVKVKVPERTRKAPPPPGVEEAMKLFKELKASGRIPEGGSMLMALP